MYGAVGHEEKSSAWDSLGELLHARKARLTLIQPMPTAGLADAGRIRIRRKEFKLECGEP